jgi:hypothetical protein
MIKICFKKNVDREDFEVFFNIDEDKFKSKYSFIHLGNCYDTGIFTFFSEFDNHMRSYYPHIFNELKKIDFLLFSKILITDLKIE